MKLNKLTLKDKKLIKRFLDIDRHDLSVYAFENIYIWRSLFDISWAEVDDNLCIFFKDNIGCFMYLAPLGRNKNKEAVKQAFCVMDRFNQNQDISRIENIEAKDAQFYKGLGYHTKVKSYDYLCLRSDLAALRGNQFKHKRASFNFFSRHYQGQYLSFSLKYKQECLALYNHWRKQRQNLSQDSTYGGMQEDSLKALTIMLNNFKGLNLTGRLVVIDKQIKAFTFGFKLNPETFCILYEITDLSIKGLAQFIFRQICGELTDYKYINIMDDSGLDNLKRVKLSYRPVKLIPAYIAKRYE
ncbi:MAG: hypothetical protein A3K83_05590 [Omnitrophica WOR_2 bacterium RBG_13_44_8b]|nr:MAG: hypothetical protein A3K83_05590 [Omnitrophica WOR_2 bacterium RBG_13_44_8b]